MNSIKRNELNIESKIKLIDDYEKKRGSQRDLATKYNISQSCVNTTIKKRDLIMEEYAVGNKKMKRLKKNNLTTDLNNLVNKFIINANNKHIPLSGTLIKAKAQQLANEMGLEFKGSNGWFESFKKRYQINFGKISGESASVAESHCIDWLAKVPQIIKDYKEFIYNCDETGLSFRALPDKSYFNNLADRHGIKISKKRLTVLLACNAAGHKLKPLVIGKSKKPRCFKAINHDLSRLDVTYYANSKAWMAQLIFSEWLIKFGK